MARTGRPPVLGVNRDSTVCVRFSFEEMEAMNVARGEQARSDFVRDAVATAVKRRMK
jgi:hypothetical protein